MSYQSGLNAENKFKSLLNAGGFESVFIDDYYDFNVWTSPKRDPIHVEVKSVALSVKKGGLKHKTNRGIGAFEFKNSENLEKLKKDDGWVCLIIRINDEYIVFGFIKARNIRQKRFLSIHQAKELGAITFDKWLFMIGEKGASQ